MTAASAGSIQGPRSSSVSTSLLGPILPTVVSDSMPLPLVVTLRLCILLAATARIGSGICFKGGVLRLAVSPAPQIILRIPRHLRIRPIDHFDLERGGPLPGAQHVLQRQLPPHRLFPCRPQLRQTTQPPVHHRTRLLGLAKNSINRPIHLDAKAAAI